MDFALSGAVSMPLVLGRAFFSTKLTDCEVTDLKLLNPQEATFFFAARGHTEPVEAVFVEVGVAKPVLTHKAEQGFVGVTVPYLKKLYTHLKLKPPKGTRRPQTLNPILTALFTSVWPDISKERLAELLALRIKLESKAEESILLQEGNAELADEVCCDEDAADLEEKVA